MLLALDVVIFAMGIGSGTMRLRCVFVLFRRLVVFVLHGDFSLLAEECRLYILTALIVASPSGNGVFSELLRRNSRRLASHTVGGVQSDDASLWLSEALSPFRLVDASSRYNT